MGGKASLHRHRAVQRHFTHWDGHGTGTFEENGAAADSGREERSREQQQREMEGGRKYIYNI